MNIGRLKTSLFTLLFCGICCISFVERTDGVFEQYVKKQLITKGHYLSGLKNGAWSFYYPNKKLHFQGNFSQDKKEGVWFYYDENQQVKTRAFYRNGLLDSQLTFYNTKGKKIYSESYKLGNKSGKISFFDDNEKLNQELINSKDKQVFNKYHPNGAKRLVTLEWKGKKNDTTYIYYANSQPKETLSFYKNLLLSIDQTHKPNGELMDNGNFENGKGLVIRYYDDLSKKSIANYVSGYKNGIAQFYHENGQIESAGLFIKGMKTGVWKYYDEKGNLFESPVHRGLIADDEFEKEFTPNETFCTQMATVPSFIGKSKDFENYIDSKWEETMPIDLIRPDMKLVCALDEFGFVLNQEIISTDLSPEDAQAFALQLKDFPRCQPAFENGLPTASSIVFVLD